MAVSEREELNLRRKLKSGGLTDREELDIRRQLQGSTPPRPVETSQEQFPPADFSGADVLGRPPEQTIREPFVDPDQRDLSTQENLEATTTAVQENIAGIGTGIAAQPVAGIGGLAKSITSGSEEGEKTQREIQEALTFQPKSERGRQVQGDIGEALRPVAEGLDAVTSTAGDFVFDKTGSPALAAFAATAPEAALELIGFKGASRALKIRRGQPNGPTTPKEARLARAALEKAAPEPEMIKDVARGVFKEIDEAGGTMNPEALQTLTNRANREARKSGLKSDGAVQGVLNELDDALGGSSTRTDPVSGQPVTVRVGEGMSLTRLDEIRSKAQAAAKNPEEAAAAVAVINSIDAFLDEAGDTAVNFKKAGVNAGKNYRHARKLWGQAKRGELIADSFDKAGRQATGFENGIRTQFRQILNNKNKSRFFSKQELAAMDDVVKGTGKSNMLKLLGRFGFGEGQSTNIIGGTLAAYIGREFGGKVGAVAAPLAGQVFRKLSQMSTKTGADFADAIIRSGRDGKKIAEAYIKNVPKAQRNPQDLGKLLLLADDPIPGLKQAGTVVREAQQIADETKKALAAAAGTGAIALELKERGLESEQ